MSKECKFIIPDQTKNNVKVCTVCNVKHFSFHKPEEIHRICKLDRKEPSQTKLILEIPKRKEKPIQEMPPVSKQIFNFLGAVKDFIASPGFVSKEEYEARIAICDTCPLRRNNRCTKCGCNLTLKARGAAFHCPEKKWPGD
jgi:hypothetical protein